MLVLCQNKKGLFNYEIEETMEAGISLFGSEVKSLRVGGGSMADGYVGTYNGGLGCINFQISKYKNSRLEESHDVDRIKPLLLHKRQITKWLSKTKQSGFTIIPLKAYFKGNKIKVEIALARGKKLHNKKQALKEKDIARDVARELKCKF